MQRQRRKTKNLVIIFALIIACIYVGYSLITSNLQVRTSLDVAKTSFDVHFENVKINEESTIETLPTLSEDKTKLSFNITLNAPGDTYIVDADIYNAGTIDAVINDLSLEGMDSAISETLTTKMIYTIDNTTVAKNDLIKSGEIETIKIAIAYPYSPDDTESDLLAEPLSANILFNIEYAKPDEEKLNNNEYNIRPFRAYNYISSNAVLDNIKSKYVTSSNGIDFSLPGSDTNGKGIYTISSTVEDDYPISYYRGDISNNYVIVNNLCWKMVRTTDTGGVKLIFSDRPNSDGTCNSSTDIDTYYSAMKYSITNYNDYNDDNAYIGFRYGTPNSNSYSSTHQNTNKSKALEFVENFYNNGAGYLYYSEKPGVNPYYYNSFYNEDVLEEQSFCYDRTIANDITELYGQSYNNLGYNNNNTAYSGYKRLAITKNPTLNCSDNDKFTGYYGMLTTDEAMYAGLTMWNENTPQYNNYLDFGDKYYWLMTPMIFHGQAGMSYVVNYNGSGIYIDSISNSFPLFRAVISLNNNAIIYKGDGTASNPFFIYNSAKYIYTYESSPH